MAVFRGYSYPFRKGSNSLPESAEDAQLIRDSITQILSTVRGERVMRPAFGSNLIRLVFENNNAVLRELIHTEISASIGQFEPRVMITNIDIQQEDSTVIITVDYILRLTGQKDSIEATFNINRIE